MKLYFQSRKTRQADQYKPYVCVVLNDDKAWSARIAYRAMRKNGVSTGNARFIILDLIGGV